MTIAVDARGPSRRLWTFAGVLAGALLAFAAATLWHLRAETLDSQTRQLAVLSLAVSDEIDRHLLEVRDGLADLRPEMRAGRPGLRSTDLGPGVPAIWWLDDAGRVVSATGPAAPPPLGSFLPAPATLRGDDAALSADFRDPASGETRVALALPFDRGWLIAAFPRRALLGAFSAATPAADARIGVYRADGLLLAGTPIDAPAGAPLVQRRTLPHFGLRIVIARDPAAALGTWGQVASGAAVGLATLLAVLALAVALVQRADRRRAEAQQALQAQIARSGKLEAMGALAGGVAHDFNNVLAAVLGHAEIARESLAPAAPGSRHMDGLVQAALRGKALVERILAFGRGSARRSEVFELQPVIEEVLQLLAATLRPGIVIERRLEAPGARARGDPTQAFQAVMNLCINGLQAMPGGGTLVVELKLRHETEPQLLSHAMLTPGRWLALSVTDQGGGISPQVMERLFEPFFSTRAAQGGSGLGLAVVHGVVAEFGGAIDVQSPPAKGARFTLYLPECDDALTLAPPLPESLPGGRGQTVLVVDDDPQLVALTEEMLAALGYEPVGFSDPLAALAALRAEPGRFDAIVSDEMMPGLTGTDLARAVRTLVPAPPVLLQSGYGGAQLAARAQEAGVARVLAKPLQRDELARALAALFG